MVSTTMHNLIIEKRPLNNRTISSYLANDIHTHMLEGKIAVVANQPLALLASTRKQWFKLMHRVRCVRSATLGLSRIAELMRRLLKWRI